MGLCCCGWNIYPHPTPYSPPYPHLHTTSYPQRKEASSSQPHVIHTHQSSLIQSINHSISPPISSPPYRRRNSPLLRLTSPPQFLRPPPSVSKVWGKIKCAAWQTPGTNSQPAFLKPNPRNGDTGMWSVVWGSVVSACLFVLASAVWFWYGMVWYDILRYASNGGYRTTRRKHPRPPTD
jgi:hypothetical protein